MKVRRTNKTLMKLYILYIEVQEVIRIRSKMLNKSLMNNIDSNVETIDNFLFSEASLPLAFVFHIFCHFIMMLTERADFLNNPYLIGADTRILNRENVAPCKVNRKTFFVTQCLLNA